MIELSSEPQLFLDDHLIAKSRGLTRVLEEPVKHPANPLLVGEHPWEERAVQCYGNALYDAERKCFRFWYFAAEERDPMDVPWEVPEEARQKPKRIYNICYAESANGVAWERRMVDAIDFPPYPSHNILIADMHSVCVLHEPDDSVPGRRYKALGGKKLGVSADGIRWETRLNQAVGKNDTGSSVVRWRGEYLAFVRQQESCPPDWPLVRAVGLSTSADFESWTPKETVLQTDEADGYPFTQPYGLTVWPRGDVLMGILWMIVLDRVEEKVGGWQWNNRVGDIRTELVASRDGRTWERVAGRSQVLEPTPGTWDQARAYPATSLLAHEGKVWLYYTGTEKRHGQGHGASGIGLATWEEDRFVALVPEDDAETAEFQTPPLQRPEGAELVVNAGSGGGAVAVAVRGESGLAVPGFEFDKSALVPVDELCCRVCWGERSLAEAPRRSSLAFRIGRGARLYGFRCRRSEDVEIADDVALTCRNSPSH